MRSSHTPLRQATTWLRRLAAAVLTVSMLHESRRRRPQFALIRTTTLVIGTAAVLLLATGEAAAHGAPLDRRVDIGDFNGDPVAWLCLTLLGGLYLRGLMALRRRGSSDRVVSRVRAAAYFVGWTCLAIALVSPLDLLGEQLAWVHMTQHMILMTVAAPLMVIGAPGVVALWGLPPEQQRAFGRCRRWLDRRGVPWRLAWNPLLILLLYTLATWLWHVPALYQAALRGPAMHDLQHLTFFAAAWLFWRVVLDPFSRFRLRGVVAVIYLFAATMQATLLGVFMTVAPSAWYADYIGRTELWGLTPLEDQQLAGLIMWMPACAAYVAAAVVLLAVAIGKEA